MISFDLCSQERYLKSLNGNILNSEKHSLYGIYSNREKNSKNILSSSLIQNQSSLILNNSNGNINNKSLNSFLYQNSPTTPSDDYQSFVYDIKINELRQKLRVLKEQNKIKKNNINLTKLRINKLQNEEKASLRELEQTQKRILKIKSNREKNFRKKNIPKKKSNLYLTSIKNRTLNNTSSNSKRKIILSAQENKSQNILKIKKNSKNIINKHNSLRINLNYKKYSQNNLGLISPKMNYLLVKNGINNSYDMIQIDKDDNNNDIKNNLYPNKSPLLHKNINNNINNKNEFKNQMKNNIIKKLKEDELQKKKIEEEIKQIEKEQYQLWINFNQNINSRRTTNTNIINNKKMKLFYENQNDQEYEEGENMINYNYI